MPESYRSKLYVVREHSPEHQSRRKVYTFSSTVCGAKAQVRPSIVIIVLWNNS
ncbi:hypothetical protein Hdeb2414_s0012g00391441 [Helianthus debilis subsp. tardiflorus]